MNERPKKNRGFLRMLLIVILACVMVLAVVLAVRSQQDGGLGALWRSLSGEELAEEFFYDNASGGLFGELDGGLAVMSASGLHVYDASGELRLSRLFSYGAPALHVKGGYGAACDIGGNTVIFFSAGEVIGEIRTDYPVVSAAVNSAGYLTVCTEENNYMGAVTVYNALGTAIYRWRAGSDRILSARVEGSELLVLTIGEGGSRLVKYSLTSEELQAEYRTGELMIAAEFTKNGVRAVTTSGVIGLSDALEERWTYDFGGRYLAGYEIGSELTALSLSGYMVEVGCTVLTLDDNGQELGVASLSGVFTDLALGDDRVYVLSEGVGRVFGREMSLLWSFEAASGAERVLARSDGSALCAGAFSAYVHKEGE